MSNFVIDEVGEDCYYENDCCCCLLVIFMSMG